MPCSHAASVEDSFWPLRLARELDDAILHLRINELETAALIFKTLGESRHAARRLQRILRTDQPPDIVEVKLFQRLLARVYVTPVRRVERSPKQSHAQTVR